MNMKKSFLISFLLMCCLPIMAQHINFLGKPIGCSINTFKQRMVERGFKSNGEVEPTAYSFDGVFGGDRVLVAAYVTQKSKIVYDVGVFYLDFISKSYDSSSQSSQSYKFDRLVESFTKKYGEPSIKKAEYVQWKKEEGDILIVINGDEEDVSRHLIVWYQDKEARETRDVENESDY